MIVKNVAVESTDFIVAAPMSNNQLSEALAGIQAPPLQARAPAMAAAGNGRERRLIISSRLADGYQLTEIGLKNLQHVFTVWFPRAVYHDLTDDTVRVDIVIRKGWASGRGVFATSFLRADGSVAKVLQYDEDRFVGRVCDHYDQKKSGYAGQKDGVDYRIAVYATEPVTIDRRG
jgi:hypothetical protein